MPLVRITYQLCYTIWNILNPISLADKNQTHITVTNNIKFVIFVYNITSLTPFMYRSCKQGLLQRRRGQTKVRD